MKTIEEILADTFKLFEAQAKEALEAALSKAYEEYLPFVENDTYFNVRQQSERWLKNFMADKLTDEDVKVDVLCKHSYDAKAVRKKIYEDNKEEIHAAIGVDLQEKIDSLKARLEDAYRRY
jgi:hypothetical protein